MNLVQAVKFARLRRIHMIKDIIIHMGGVWPKVLPLKLTKAPFLCTTENALASLSVRYFSKMSAPCGLAILPDVRRIQV
jgi:hypothetical protein